MLLHTNQSATQIGMNQVSHWNNNSADDGHMTARNMHRIEIDMHEKIVRQVGYLQWLEEE